MKLLSVEINGYKNLKTKAQFDFTNCGNYVALIGLNGSGKSNVLEAVSIIFASLYRGSQISTWNNGSPVDYKIKYSIKGNDILIQNGVVTLLKEGNVVRNRIIRSNRKEYLPSEVISCYSGDELRMWDDIYSKFYFSYLAKIGKGYRTTKQELVYVNKYSWEFSLVCLLCNPIFHPYLKDLLKISDLSLIRIRFDFPANYTQRKNWFSRNVEEGLAASNEITDLIQRIKDEQDRTGYLSYTQISSIDVGVVDPFRLCRKLFYLFFAAGMPRENKLFKGINIELAASLTTKHLSEGEKKSVLIKCVMDVLANENSLVLLDEPDSYIHVAKKIEIERFVNKTDCFTMLTTHSPSLLHNLRSENIFIVSNKDKTGLVVLPADKQKHLEEISGGVFSLMDATLAVSTTKDILLVEGTNDYDYLNEALKRLKPTFPQFDFLIVNCGGAGNVAAVLEQSILPILSKKQLCICMFDEDEAGRNGIKSVDKILSATPVDNVKRLTHPRVAGFPVDAKEYFMEDYFSVDAYKALIEADVTKKTRFKEYDQMPKAKSVIASNYKIFPDDAYNGFKVIISEILKIQQEFHKPAKKTARKVPAKSIIKTTRKVAKAVKKK